MANDHISYTREQRLRLFYRRMGASEPAARHDEAMAMLASALNDVEDEFSGVPFDEERAGTDGRMYPPSERYRNLSFSRPGIHCYFQTAHATFVSENGAIEIRPRRGRDLGTILFEKQGNDGRKVTDYDSSE